MKIKIGTRKSKLALAQTELVYKALKEQFPGIEIEIIHITTKGDKVIDRPLAEIGGKGIFISEIEQALLNNEIDIAVHSAKDLPVKIAEGLRISAVLKRSDPRDVLVLRKGEFILNKMDFTIGTGSIRRKLFMHRLYPDISFSDIRGNVDTRINKLLDGQYDGLILAAAGIERLRIREEKISITPFDIDEFIPAPCQGIIAVESRENDIRISQFADKINDTDTFVVFETERYIIEKNGGGCDVPLGAYAKISENKINLKLSADAVNIIRGTAYVADRFSLAERLVNKI